jgi:hypothetical protein
MKKLIVGFLMTLLLAGCGGGAEFGSSSSSTSSSSASSSSASSTAAASVSVSASSLQIPTDGSASTTITALARDVNNVALSGVAVSFSTTTSAGVLVVTQGTTDNSGNATATLTAASSAVAGTTITVSAASGSVSGNVNVSIVNTQKTITLTTSLPQIPSDGSKPATITALVRDANNQALQGVTVTFQSTSGIIGGSPTITDANGAAPVTLSNAGDPTNRSITVTATAGSASTTIPVNVVGTTLTMTGATSLVQLSQGTYTLSLTDSGGKAIVGKTVTVTSSKGNTLNATSLTTDSSGHATAQLTAVNAGTDTLTATALGLTAQQNVVVSSQSFQFSSPTANTKIPLGISNAQTVTVQWKSNGSNVADGTVVNFASTRGTLSAASATTIGGLASITIYSNTAGPAVINATGTSVSAQLNVDFVATVPSAVAIQASPATVDTQGQSTITAIVRDANNNLIEGQQVDFSLSDTTGGSLSVASAVTDVQGRAQTVYTANSTSSSSSGVTITASVTSTSVTPSAVTLTVGGQAVFLSLGTGNKLQEDANKTKFIQNFVVQAVDSKGNAVNNVPITLTVHSTYYAKGAWNWNGLAWQQNGTPTQLDANGNHVFTAVTVCPNEDANLNGIREPNLGEDIGGLGNNNGVLDPGDIALANPGSVVTATDGSASFSVNYPEDHALWVEVQLVASTPTQGTQSSTSATYWLPVLSDYVTTQSVSPPGISSPYGIATSCTNRN